MSWKKQQPFNTTCDVTIDWRAGMVTIQQQRKVKLITKGVTTIKVTLDDFLTPGKVGFELLHNKLQLLGATYKFDADALIERLATTPILRLIHLTRDMGIPQYVGTIIFRLLVEMKACVWYQSAIVKTTEYVEFLRHIINTTTAPTVATVKQNETRYRLPPKVEGEYGETLETMSVEMLLLEIENAENLNAKKKELEILRGWLHKKQQEERSQQAKGKGVDEFAQAMAAVQAEQEEEAATPSRKKRKER